MLTAAQANKRMLVGVTVEFLLRTGLRVGEYTALTADAVVLIGETHWLHVPVGKLHEDRYLPLHPHLVDLITSYRAKHVPQATSCVLLRPSSAPSCCRREDATAARGSVFCWSSRIQAGTTDWLRRRSQLTAG